MKPDLHRTVCASCVLVSGQEVASFRGRLDKRRGLWRRERKWVELPPQTMQAIQDWLLVRGSDQGPLFTNLDRRTKRARLTGTALYKIVRCLGEDVGLKTRPHGIRHATITQRIASGMTLPEVQDFSRRSDNKTLMIYNDRLENAAGRLAAMADSGI